MNEIAPLLAVLVATFSVCALALTGVAVFLAVRWHRRAEEAHAEVYEPPARLANRLDDPSEESVAEFVSEAKALDQWALDEWVRERMEEDDWSESDVREFLDNREPIELT